MSGPSIECSCVTAPGEAEPPTGLEVANTTASSTHLKWQVCAYMREKIEFL